MGVGRLSTPSSSYKAGEALPESGQNNEPVSYEHRSAPSMLSALEDACRLSISPEERSRLSRNAEAITRYDDLTLSLRWRTTSIALRVSASLRATPMFEAIAKKSVWSLR